MSTLKELISLKGRSALVTGATGFLGRIFADSLAELGADLIFVDQEGCDSEALKKSIVEKWGVSVESIICNLEQGIERERLIRFMIERQKNINILVNNAAFVGSSNLAGWNVPFQQQTIETWRLAIEVNLTAAFDLCKGLAPILNKAEGASIVNIGSIYGCCGPDLSLYKGTDMSNPAAYSVSKGGLIQLTRWLSTTLAPSIRVNTISPGGIWRAQHHEFVEKYIARTPLGRMATEEDFRGAIAYLASDLSKYVTGHNLLVDGGWSVW